MRQTARRSLRPADLLLAIALAGGVLAGGALAAQQTATIPSHPSKLDLPAARFELPDARALRHELSNGVAVYVAEDHTLPLVDVAVAIRAGDYLDPFARPGLATLVGAMVRRGGSERYTPHDLDQQVDLLGADLDSFAGSTRSGAALDVTRRLLPEALDLLFEMLRRPRFDAARLEAVRANLAASMRQRTVDPLAVLGLEWQWLLYGSDHFTTRPLTPFDLEAISREELIAFHRSFWVPANMIFAVSGDVDTAWIVAELERRFAGWETGSPSPWPPPAPRHRPRPGLYHLERDLDQGKVALGHLGFQRNGWDDREAYALEVVNQILGGELVARIGGRVRSVEGLAYQTSAHLGIGVLWPGDFQIYLESKNETVALAAKLAREEVERLRREAPPAGELALAKRALIDALPLAFDSAEEIAGYYAEDELTGRPHRFWAEYRERIESVTANEVRRAAERYLHPERMVVLSVGRWDEIAPGDPERRATMKDLHEGEVTLLPERDPLTLKAVSPQAQMPE